MKAKLTTSVTETCYSRMFCVIARVIELLKELCLYDDILFDCFVYRVLFGFDWNEFEMVNTEISRNFRFLSHFFVEMNNSFFFRQIFHVD